MLEIIGLLMFGFFVGAYGTLVGIGGGPLIVPMLTLAYHYPPSSIISISLFAIFFNTLSGTTAYIKQKRVDIINGTKFGLATIPGAFLSTYAVDFIPLHTFSTVFGLFLIVLAIYIFTKPKETEIVHLSYTTLSGQSHNSSLSNTTLYQTHIRKITPERTIEDAMGNIYNYRVNVPAGVGISALIGALSTFLGIGGGVIQVPALVYLLSFPVHIGTATSHYITAINTLFTLIPFITHGDIVYRTAVLLSLGVIAGAQSGAQISTKISAQITIRLLTPVFVLTGIKLLFS
ncbi:MAG: sulfite exporter TauE/SafE family protein [bacterium]